MHDPCDFRRHLERLSRASPLGPIGCMGERCAMDISGEIRVQGVVPTDEGEDVGGRVVRATSRRVRGDAERCAARLMP